MMNNTTNGNSLVTISHLMKKENLMKQSNKNILWWLIQFEGNSGVKRKETRVSPIFHTFVGHCVRKIDNYIFPYYITLVSFLFTPLLPSNSICHQLSHIS